MYRSCDLQSLATLQSQAGDSFKAELQDSVNFGVIDPAPLPE